MSVFIDEVDVSFVFCDEILDDGWICKSCRQKQRNFDVLSGKTANFRREEHLDLGFVTEFGRENVTDFLDVTVFDGRDQSRAVRSLPHSRCPVSA